MENSLNKPITYDIKKEKRFQAKKRKLEALLNLFQEEDKTPLPEKKPKETDTTKEKEYKALKDQLKLYMKKPEVEPCFFLTEIGSKSQIKIKDPKSTKKIYPLFVENVYQLLLKSVIGHMSPHNFNWAKLEQPQNITRTVLLVVEGLPKSVLLRNRFSLTNLIDIFPFVMEIASPNIPFPQELTTLHKVTHFHIENKDSYSTMFPSKKIVKIDVNPDIPKVTKVHLLLSPIQLVMENYPLPQNVFRYSKSENYTFSKDAYIPVTAESPLFAIDCEMCRTEKASHELTHVALVNENLEVVYQTLVKPKTKIIDYMTKYSGITKSKLKGVKTTLSDVQQKLREILPPDAILCGQSLNCDLHALKMIHPYCVDTSIIFNSSGIRCKKDSLKYLTKIHLNESIQDCKDGHNPVEDAIATMRLVKLKLENSAEFGDSCLESTSNESTGIGLNNASNEHQIKNDVGFFDLIHKYDKKVCLIGKEETLSLYGNDIPNTVQKLVKATLKKSVKAVINNMENVNLTIGHLDFNCCDESDLISELDQIIKAIFDVCSNRTMVMVLTSEVDRTKFEDIRSGMFMATVKKDI